MVLCMQRHLFVCNVDILCTFIFRTLALIQKLNKGGYFRFTECKSMAPSADTKRTAAEIVFNEHLCRQTCTNHRELYFLDDTIMC